MKEYKKKEVKKRVRSDADCDLKHLSDRISKNVSIDSIIVLKTLHAFVDELANDLKI